MRWVQVNCLDRLNTEAAGNDVGMLVSVKIDEVDFKKT